MANNTEEVDQTLEFGTIAFAHKENEVPDVKCDRLAHDGGELCLVGLVAPSHHVKAIRAILHARQGTPWIKPHGVHTLLPSSINLMAAYNLQPIRRTPGDLRLHENHGYETHLHKLDYGLVHALFTTRNPNFIRYLSPGALWEKLNSDRHTTPLLPEWMPWVTGELVRHKSLRECRCFRANSALLDIPGDEKLDEIVSSGLKSKSIRIP